jgi:hypothetical protein
MSYSRRYSNKGSFPRAFISETVAPNEKVIGIRLIRVPVKAKSVNESSNLIIQAHEKHC